MLENWCQYSERAASLTDALKKVKLRHKGPNHIFK